MIQDKLELIFIGIVVLSSVVGTLLRKWSVRSRVSGSSESAYEPGSAAIITYYTAGHELMNAGEGTVADMHYVMYMTGPLSRRQGEGFINESAVIYSLDLPFNTQTHLVGLSKEYKLDRLQFEAFLSGTGMVRDSLEGDFPDYFDLYSAPGQGMEVRTVLDPDSMAFVVDYCRNHFWEIHDAQLYFVVTDKSKGDTDFIQESAKFVASIRPALLPGDPNAPEVHHAVPYGEYDGPALLCPICKATMMLHDRTWFDCPAGHGALLTGYNLKQLNNHELRIVADATKAASHNALKCPNCQHPMERVRYQGGVLQIDSCTNCTYRWLDANEITKLST